VLGSAGTTDGLVVAIVPRIRRPSVHKGRETGKRKGKWPERVDAKDITLALFEPDDMIARDGQKAVETTPVDKKNFVNVLRDLLVNQVNALDCPDLAGFDWADLPIVPGDSVYRFDGQLFYRGLLLLPLLAFDTVTVVTAPTSHEIIPFAQSNIDPLHIDSLLSQLHWQPGDRVSRGDDIYKLEDVQLENGCVLAFPLQFQPTEEPAIVQIPIDELQRRFFVGDAVVVLAGVHQGATGSVLSEEDGILNLLTGDDGTYVSMLKCTSTGLTDTSLCSWKVSARSQWVTSCLAPSSATIGPSDHLMLGDLLRVLDGPDRLREGRLEQKIDNGTQLYLRDMRTDRLVSIVDLLKIAYDSFYVIVVSRQIGLRRESGLYSRSFPCLKGGS
jgi:hypothetical protein